MRIYKLPELEPWEEPCRGSITDRTTGDVVMCALRFGHEDDCARGFLRWDPRTGSFYSCREFRSAAAYREWRDLLNDPWRDHDLIL